MQKQDNNLHWGNGTRHNEVSKRTLGGAQRGVERMFNACVYLASKHRHSEM